MAAKLIIFSSFFVPVIFLLAERVSAPYEVACEALWPPAGLAE